GKVAGYRVLRLATVSSPVAVRVVGSDGQVPKTEASALSVQATDASFAAAPDSWETLTFADAQFRTARPLANVACLTVAVGSRKERFPFPVVGPDPVAGRGGAADGRAEAGQRGADRGGPEAGGGRGPVPRPERDRPAAPGGAAAGPDRPVADPRRGGRGDPGVRSAHRPGADQRRGEA